jgi:hypothetical protein
MSRVRNKADHQTRTLDFDGDSVDDVTFDSVTITGALNITSTGNTTFTAGANIELDASNRVQVLDTPFKLASFTNTTRTSNIASPSSGDLIYNSTENKVQVYLNGAWTSFFTASLNKLQDTDDDTYINVEASADVDQIDFYTNGNLRMRIDELGDLTFGASLNKFTIAQTTGNTVIAGNLQTNTFTSTSTASFTGNLELNSASAQNFDFGDDDKLRFGAGNDFQLHHDTSTTPDENVINSQVSVLKIQQGGNDKISVTDSQVEMVSPLKTVSIKEKATLGNTTSGDINFDFIGTGASVLYLYQNQIADRTINFRGDASTALNNVLSDGESISAAVLFTNAATTYRLTTVQVDGNVVTPKWVGGTIPSAGFQNAVSAYSFSIIKIATNNFHILASITEYK